MNNRILLFAVAASLGCVNVVASNKETGATDFQDVLTKLMPQVSFTPNAMGS